MNETSRSTETTVPTSVPIRRDEARTNTLPADMDWAMMQVAIGAQKGRGSPSRNAM